MPLRNSPPPRRCPAPGSPRRRIACRTSTSCGGTGIGIIGTGGGTTTIIGGGIITIGGVTTITTGGGITIITGGGIITTGGDTIITTGGGTIIVIGSKTRLRLLHWQAGAAMSRAGDPGAVDPAPGTS